MEKRREESGSVRTWPGIVLLVGIAVVMCVGIYIFAYKTGYLPMPAYLERLLHLQERTDVSAADGSFTRAFFRSLPDAVTETVTEPFAPRESDAKTLFASLSEPASYRQRMRITEQTQADAEGERRVRSVTLTVDGSCAQLEKSADGADGSAVELVLFDSARGLCWRGSRENGNVYAAGKHTFRTELGIPALADVQARTDLALSFSPTDKTVTAEYTVDGTTWTLVYAVDYGLLMEMRIERDGVRVCSVFTDQYSLYPTLDPALFRFPEEAGEAQ